MELLDFALELLLFALELEFLAELLLITLELDETVAALELDFADELETLLLDFTTELLLDLTELDEDFESLERFSIAVEDDETTTLLDEDSIELLDMA